MLLAVAFALLPVLGPTAQADDFSPNDLLVGTTDGEVRQFDPELDEVRDVSLVSPAVRSPESPRAMAMGPSGRLYVVAADVDSDVLLMINGGSESGSGIVLKAALDFNLDMQGVAFGPTGRIYVTSAADNLVYSAPRSLPNGLTKDDLTPIGAGSGIDDPRGLTFGPDGHMYVANNGSASVLEFDPSGVLVGEIGGDPMTSAGFLAFGIDGHLYVASPADDTVFVFDGSGAIVGQIPVTGPGGIACGPDSNTWIVSNDTGNVHAFDADGTEVKTLDDADQLAGPLIFSPFRMTLKTKLTIRDTVEPKETKQKSEAVVSLRSGWPTMMIELDDELGALVGADCLVLRGFETFEVDDPKGARSRLLQGQAFSMPIPAPAPGGEELDEATEAITSMVVTMKGKVDKKTGFFTVKNAKGTLLSGGAEVASFGTTKTSKLKP